MRGPGLASSARLAHGQKVREAGLAVLPQDGRLEPAAGIACPERATGSSGASRGKPANKLFLLRRAPVLHLDLAAPGGRLGGVCLSVDKCDRSPPSSVVRPQTCVVHPDALFGVEGDAAVERPIRAADEVERPQASIWHGWPLDPARGRRSGCPSTHSLGSLARGHGRSGPSTRSLRSLARGHRSHVPMGT